MALSKNLFQFWHDVSGRSIQAWQAEWLNCSDADLIPIIQCGSWEQLCLDFIALKKVKVKTIRVLTGNFSNTFLSDEYEAETIINSLNELKYELIRKFN